MSILFSKYFFFSLPYLFLVRDNKVKKKKKKRQKEQPQSFKF